MKMKYQEGQRLQNKFSQSWSTFNRRREGERESEQMSEFYPKMKDILSVNKEVKRELHKNRSILSDIRKALGC